MLLPLVFTCLLFSRGFLFGVYAAPHVIMGGTTVTGTDIPTWKQEFFGGIPFAEQPVGKLRLRPPALRTSLGTTVFNASQYGASCLQTTAPTEFPLSESCLTINILRPAGLPANPPDYGLDLWGRVLRSMYNGSAIVAQAVSRQTPIIHISFNYRLGPLGFPQGQEAINEGILNLGLKDQLTALQWIQANVGAFGGDKSKVTVFGESAGSVSIAVLYLNSHLERLARAAIFESGFAATTLTYKGDRPDRQVDWDNFVQAVPSCASLASTQHSLACLQQANSTELLEALGVAFGKSDEQFPWSPTIDGPRGLMPDLPSRLFKRGQFSRLPFIAGTNLDEGTLFTPTTNFTASDLRSSLIANMTPSEVGSDRVEAAVDKVLALYPDDPALGSPINTGNDTFGLSSQYKRAAQIFNDLHFQSQRRMWVQTASAVGVKTYAYLYTDPVPASPIPARLGVSHGQEIPYVYGAPFADPTGPPLSKTFSTTMIDYWVSFATSLDPNDGRGIQRPLWPVYTADSQVLLQLHRENTTVIPDDYRKERIGFFNSKTNAVTFRHRRSSDSV